MPGVMNLSGDGGLRVFDGKGRSVWSSDPGVRGSKAMITDAGNFIMLADGHNVSEIVWESFAHPTDTWLPGMKLWKGMKLTSWKSSVDPATGLFSFQMDTSPGKTQFLMVYNNSVPYWSSGEWTGNYFVNIPEVYCPQRCAIYCARISPSRIYFNYRLFRPGQGHTLTLGRVLFDEKGVLRILDWMDDGTWTQSWATYKGPCSAYDICGANGLCNANDVCSCVEGFMPKRHKTPSWLSSGCVRRRSLQCSTDGFLESNNRSLPEEEAVPYKNEHTMQGCRIACLNNCSCTAFAFVISEIAVCRLWFGDLFKMRVSSDSRTVFIRLAASELPQLTSRRTGKAPPLYILLPSVAACCAVLSLLLLTIVLRKCPRQRKKSVEEEVPIMLKTFTYKELRIATGNFRHKLGSGAFGSVFKGTLMDSTLVAVKRLEGSARAEKQFRAEINTIGRIQHVNLVRLCGFCVEGSRRLLVYAYMPNGSLNSSLFSVERVLDWRTRFEVALGTARGLVYLHEECRDQIIHCDIKPENILLDDHFSPKIADFGLAKLVGRDFSRVLTTTRGTRGYLAPEWISGLPITPKVDVYSFGMTLLEIISGRRNLDLTVEESRWYFPTWASSEIQRGNVMGIVDARIASEANIEEVRIATVVGVLCIQDDENQRPSMGEVVKILEGKIEVPAPQIPRSLQVLLDQVEDNKSDVLFQHPCTSSGGSVPTQQWF